MQAALLPRTQARAYELRPYQAEGIQKVEEAWERNQRPLVVLATGLGKTVLFSETIRRLVARGRRSLVLAHRIELLDQAAAKLCALGVDAAVEQGPRRATGHEAVVASVQTLRGPRLQAWPRDAFDDVIIDEAHHATADGYRAILEHFSAARVMGVTATPDRADGQGLGQVFDVVPMAIQLPEAIQEGWLVDIEARLVEVQELDLGALRKPREPPPNAKPVENAQAALLGPSPEAQVRDWTDRELIKLIEPAIPHVVKPLAEQTAGMQTLVFLPGKVCTEAAAQMLRTMGLTARAIHQDTPDGLRKLWVRSYQEGRLQYLINCGVFTEGFDAPRTEAVVICRPTKSQSLYTQMVGRGTRPADEIAGKLSGLATADERRAVIAASSKPSCLVLHFQGCGVGQRLVSPIDLFAGQLDPDEREQAEKKLRSRKERVSEAIADARAVVAVARKEAAERSAKERQREHLAKRIHYTVQSVDPFGVGRRTFEHWEHNPWSSMSVEPALLDGSITPNQLAWATEKLKVKPEVAKLWSARHARKIQQTSGVRMQLRLCTYRQACVLRRHGVSPSQLSLSRAGELIDELARNGWKRPDNWIERGICNPAQEQTL